jgi:hypothetical protein
LVGGNHNHIGCDNQNGGIMSLNTFKLGLRNGMTIPQYRAELKRRQINAKLAHARWAGRHLAKLFMLQSDFNFINARGRMGEELMVQTLLGPKYRVHPLLIQYATKVAKEHLRG